MLIREMRPVERPRERLLKSGPQTLTDEELVAVLLRTGYAGLGALDLAGELLRRFPKDALARLPIQQLRKLKGVGASRAAALAAAVELGRRWSQAGDEERARFEEPSQVWENLHDLRGKRREHFVAFYLNARNRLIQRETVSIGTLMASLVHPREVFAPAIERRAAAVIVAHNHPSGDLSPSPEDVRVTRQIAQAGRILGVGLLDHVLVSEAGFMSFRKEGLL